MDKRLLELAVEIVQSQTTLGKMAGEEIESVLIKVYNALHQIQEAEKEGRTAAMGDVAVGVGRGGSGAESSENLDPRASIQENKVICLECGAEFRQLTANHLRSHGLTPRDYKGKWGFPLKQPLAAKVLTRLRSESAKERGLPEKLQQFLEVQRQKKKGPAVEMQEEAAPAPEVAPAPEAAPAPKAAPATPKPRGRRPGKKAAAAK